MTLTRRIPPTRVVAILVLVVAASVPVATGADPAQQEPSAQERQSEVRARQGEVAVEVDLLEARSAEVGAALDTLAANVATQQAELEEAERAVAEAEEDLVEADAAVAAAEERIEALNAATDQLVVDAYMQPPAESAFDALAVGTISDATIKRALLDIQSDNDADVMDQLAAAHEDLELERQAKEAIAVEAEEKRAGAADELEQLEAAHAQQAAFAAEAEAALDSKLAEAAHLAELDQQLSAQVAAEQAELAAQLAAAHRAAEAAAASSPAAASPGAGSGSSPSSGSAPGPVTDVPGGLATVGCPRGGSITVAGALASNLQGLLTAAGNGGVGLCGWGYRSTERQIQLRRQNCGTSYYAIYQMPSWQCSPPTARPGFSQHERGLAVDFTCDGGSISSRSNRCFQWLNGNAERFGLYNLPSEPWHWSTTGR